jgi:hypothetical protein
MKCELVGFGIKIVSRGKGGLFSGHCINVGGEITSYSGHFEFPLLEKELQDICILSNPHPPRLKITIETIE